MVGLTWRAGCRAAPPGIDVIGNEGEGSVVACAARGAIGAPRAAELMLIGRVVTKVSSGAHHRACDSLALLAGGVGGESE